MRSRRLASAWPPLGRGTRRRRRWGGGRPRPRLVTKDAPRSQVGVPRAGWRGIYGAGCATTRAAGNRTWPKVVAPQLNGATALHANLQKVNLLWRVAHFRGGALLSQAVTLESRMVATPGAMTARTVLGSAAGAPKRSAANTQEACAVAVAGFRAATAAAIHDGNPPCPCTLQSGAGTRQNTFFRAGAGGGISISSRAGRIGFGMGWGPPASAIGRGCPMHPLAAHCRSSTAGGLGPTWLHLCITGPFL